MRTHRTATGGSRHDREEAAARRLAILAADLGHAAEPAAPEDEVAPDDVAPRHWPGAADSTPAPAPTEPPEGDPVLPRPGRHADRRRVLPRLPGLGAAHLAVLALLVAVALAGTTWWLLRERPRPAPEATPAMAAEPLAALSATETTEAGGSTSAAPDAAGSVAGSVTVDVAGKVRRPGIVVLDAGARVVDALEAAGGARKGVRVDDLNLARVLTDGEQIVVGRPGPAPPPAPSGGAPLVDINRASAEELEELPGVGPVTAAAIVEWREQHGGFSSVDQLIDVSGIGEKTLAEIAPHATV